MLLLLLGADPQRGLCSDQFTVRQLTFLPAIARDEGHMLTLEDAGGANVANMAKTLIQSGTPPRTKTR